MFALIRKFMALDDDDSSSSPTYFDMMTLIAQDGVPFQNPGNCIGSVNCIAASGGRAETGGELSRSLALHSKLDP